MTASDRPRFLPDRQAFAVRLDWRDVVDYLNDFLPVVVVLYHAGEDRAYWLHLQSVLREEAGRPGAIFAKTLKVHVPKANILGENAIRRIARIRDDSVSCV